MAKRQAVFNILAYKEHLSVFALQLCITSPLQSHIQDDQYFVTYTIEPMLELLWIEEIAHEDTSYKVLFPITTPPMARPPQVRNCESGLVKYSA